jgi:hypothetical protein
MKNKAKVHRLPTENEGVIISDVGPYDTDMIPTSEVPKELRSHDRPHNHLYFTTDEEIKEGDWCYQTVINKVVQARTDYYKDFRFRKIIASTDPELYTEIDNGFEKSTKRVKIHLPQPSQAFIEAYCKSGGIDEVLVELDCLQSAGLMIVDYSQDPPETVHRDEPECIEWKLKVDPIHNTIIIHPVEENKFEKQKTYILRRLEHCNKRLKQCEEKYNGKEEKHTFHGGRVMGYWLGLVEGYTLQLEWIEENL